MELCIELQTKEALLDRPPRNIHVAAVHNSSDNAYPKRRDVSVAGFFAGIAMETRIEWLLHHRDISWDSVRRALFVVRVATTFTTL